MKCRALILAAALLPAVALAGEATDADLARQLAELKQQVEQLRQQAAAKGPKIGFVNIDRVFEELDEKYDSNKSLLELEQRYDSALRELDKRLENLEKRASVLNPESPDYRKAMQELEQTKREMRSERAVAAERVFNKRFDIVHSLFSKIRDDVEAYARQRGYDLVLRVRDRDIGNFDEGMRPDHRYLDLKRRVDIRQALYWRPADDFTDAIIKRLNERYAREKAAREDRTEPTTSTTPEPEAPKTNE